ncbi:hypothetical protein CAEBREN_00615 [Caenorhabditis brenneri]|uniref:Uncharacterized protein n=1 Tax=Caenorhabditis brenneri TaxID=135651 RepID=G0N098_CAEBE|nr:hypothetical protein CAEBREN_00615 [Caenorhabditis brenneri]
MPPTFPLLRLPIDERLAVLRQMEMSHLYVTILKNSSNDTLIKCTKKEYEAKDWLEHLCLIFHQKDHRLYFEHHGSRYDLNSVYENFKNPDHLRLPRTGNADYNYRVLKMIIPKSKDQEKVFKTVAGSDHVVKGGREIRRMDGTVGRIVIDDRILVFNFFIWHE